MNRTLTFTQAIYEATAQSMELDDSVVVLGLGVDDERGLGGTTKGLVEKFGPQRVFDTPLAEEGMTGAAVGMAMFGLRPIHTHARMDFLLLGMNQVINIASKAHYMYGGCISVPMVIRVLIGDGWGPQHSQGLHSLFAHIPGLKVVAPSNPYDAKGCLVSAIRDNNPVIFVENFNLYAQKGEVPEGVYAVPLGVSKVKRSGKDITIVGISWALQQSLEAADILKTHGIEAEVVDLVSLSPMDIAPVLESVKKTGRLLAVDCAWTNCGITAEVLARVAENCTNIVCRRVGFAPVPCPTSLSLEREFYPTPQKIADVAISCI